jgi:flagellar hook protein FlgE
MGIYNALFTGASGLTAFGEGVRVIGDNIANVNTLGFKSQNVNFADVLGQTVNVSRSNIANQVGNGVRIGAITRDQAQGSVQSTTNATDMAINGAGMFVLKDPASGQTQYTRAGAFLIDANNDLINGQGFQVQGWALDSAGNPQGSVTNISAANVAANASPTSNVDVGVNLNATAPDIAPAAFDPTDPATYTSKSDVTVYDSLGSLHNLSTYFVKTGSDAGGNAVWDWHVTVDGGDVTGGTAGVQTEINEVGVGGHTTASTAGPPAVAG